MSRRPLNLRRQPGLSSHSRYSFRARNLATVFCLSVRFGAFLTLKTRSPAGFMVCWTKHFDELTFLATSRVESFGLFLKCCLTFRAFSGYFVFGSRPLPARRSMMFVSWNIFTTRDTVEWWIPSLFCRSICATDQDYRSPRPRFAGVALFVSNAS